MEFKRFLHLFLSAYDYNHILGEGSSRIVLAIPRTKYALKIPKSIYYHIEDGDLTHIKCENATTQNLIEYDLYQHCPQQFLSLFAPIYDIYFDKNGCPFGFIIPIVNMCNEQKVALKEDFSVNCYDCASECCPDRKTKWCYRIEERILTVLGKQLGIDFEQFINNLYAFENTTQFNVLDVYDNLDNIGVFNNQFVIVDAGYVSKKTNCGCKL